MFFKSLSLVLGCSPEAKKVAVKDMKFTTKLKCTGSKLAIVTVVSCTITGCDLEAQPAAEPDYFVVEVDNEDSESTSPPTDTGVQAETNTEAHTGSDTNAQTNQEDAEEQVKPNANNNQEVERRNDTESELKQYRSSLAEDEGESSPDPDASAGSDYSGFSSYSAAFRTLYASGEFNHGGSFTADIKYHTRGGRCTPGYVRDSYSHRRIHHGWSHIVGWKSPDDLNDCRIVIRTQNHMLFLEGTVYWKIFERQMNNGDWDYCTAKGGNCDEGQGDCDSDAECKFGLTCSENVGPEYGFEEGVDVCTNERTNGHHSYCSKANPCEEGEGDCDSNAECLGGLVCGDDNGAEYGLDPWVDVCR